MATKQAKPDKQAKPETDPTATDPTATAPDTNGTPESTKEKESQAGKRWNANMRTVEEKRNLDSFVFLNGFPDNASFLRHVCNLGVDAMLAARKGRLFNVAKLAEAWKQVVEVDGKKTYPLREEILSIIDRVSGASEDGEFNEDDF